MEGSIIGEKYKLGKTIGTGAFGKVRIATNIQTTCEVAVKILVRETMKKKKMEEREAPKEIYLVMEYAKNGDLLKYISEMGKLQEEEARKIFQQIISGVEYCHEKYVVHRDLKPDNLLLDSERNVKITDFGLSNIMTDGQGFNTSCGSPKYAAPEVLSGESYTGPHVDVWSCGIILYNLLCCKFPAFDNDGISTFPRHLSPTARDLISKMLTVNPMERIEIPMILKHQWFQAHLP
ncbi:hypothetical protein ACB092_08G215500 [Castanea dentata]